MLIGIDPILGPDILHGLRSMGHGDELVIADGSFPAETVARRLVRAEAAGLERMLGAVLSVLPIDESEPDPVMGMEVIGDPAMVMPAHTLIRDALTRASDHRFQLALLERFQFYERAKTAFLVIATGERRFYGNVIIRKGTVPLP